MAVITLKIDSVDFSDYIQQETDIAEQMVKITGPAQDIAVDGKTIPDLVRVKWNPSFRLKPLPQAKMNELIMLMEQESVSLQYTSVKLGSQLRSIEAMPVSMQVQYATTFNGSRIYADTPIAFEEV